MADPSGEIAMPEPYGGKSTPSGTANARCIGDRTAVPRHGQAIAIIATATTAISAAVANAQ